MASAIHQRESVIGIPVSLPSWALLPFPSPHPSRWSQSTGFGLPVSYINSHWLSVLHMVMCMFPCCSLKSYHPLLLPLLHPKICSLCPCLLCCPACRIIGAIFLDSVKVKVNLTQSCLTLCDPMDSIVHGILQARIPFFPFSRGSPQPRDWTQISHITGGFFTTWATREVFRFHIYISIYIYIYLYIYRYIYICIFPYIYMR